DKLVTGVQTCALPISFTRSWPMNTSSRTMPEPELKLIPARISKTTSEAIQSTCLGKCGSHSHSRKTKFLRSLARAAQLIPIQSRSEERRVGKESETRE